MSLRNTFAGALLLAALSAVAASAQDDMGERKGFSGSLGVGVGSGGISCTPQCSGDRLSGPALMLRVAGHASSQFTIGIEATIFRADIKTLTPAGKWSLNWLTLTGVWYPSSDDDFFLKLGLGVASTRVDVSFPSVSSINLDSSDFGVVVGIGKDFSLADKLALTVFGDILVTPKSAALTNGSTSGAKISADLIHLGLAVSIP